MPRPKRCRYVAFEPNVVYFKPAGTPLRELAEVTLTIDEFEALRLADHEGLYHEPAGERMRVSRATFGRILGAARRKVGRALVEGLALRIEGGTVETPPLQTSRKQRGNANRFQSQPTPCRRRRRNQ